MSSEQAFFQDGPVLSNQYDSDRVLRQYLKHTLPPELLEANIPALRHMGERAVTDIFALGRAVELSPPTHTPYDAWGRRIDRINVAPEWEILGRIASAEHLVGEAYVRTNGYYARVIQCARAYLYAASSAFYTCPLAMSDGAARAIELYGDTSLMRRAFTRLTTSHPSRSWISGQWMTEREGGSDVSKTSTIAVPSGEGFALTGSKWFTSAITSQMAITLARTPNAPLGNRGLSMFYVETHDADGNWNGITVRRLKDKLGTNGVPTAEIDLEGTKAIMVGREGAGVKQITAILNITRVWNAIQSIALMRRSIALARDYGYRREVFGKKLNEQSQYKNRLAHLETEFRGAFALTFYVVELLGKEETHIATPEEASLNRLLIPIAKLFTAEQAERVVADALKCFGGMGYIKDTGLSQLLCDAHVLPIWEGPPGVLARDVFRVIETTNALATWSDTIQSYVTQVACDDAYRLVRDGAQTLICALIQLKWSIEACMKSSNEEKEFGVLEYTCAIARITIGWLLLRDAVCAIQAGDHVSELEAFVRWMEAPLHTARHCSLEATRKLALGE